jgi:hypothetical protein
VKVAAAIRAKVNAKGPDAGSRRTIIPEAQSHFPQKREAHRWKSKSKLPPEVEV